METIDFKEANFTFTKPEDMTDEECGNLRVFKGKDSNGTPCIISKWQPDADDIKAILNGGAVYLKVIGAGTPPVYLFTENPF